MKLKQCFQLKQSCKFYHNISLIFVLFLIDRHERQAKATRSSCFSVVDGPARVSLSMLVDGDAKVVTEQLPLILAAITKEVMTIFFFVVRGLCPLLQMEWVAAPHIATSVAHCGSRCLGLTPSDCEQPIQIQMGSCALLLKEARCDRVHDG